MGATAAAGADPAPRRIRHTMILRAPNSGRRNGDADMPKFALIASIEVAPGRRDEFLPLLRAHAARCLKDEPGTLQFDVLLPHDGGDKVMLYELYQDQAAFDAHSNGPSLAQLRKEAAGMMGKVSGTRCSLSE
jgi:(4S)-4-hydroxy-5-phosphonooxypentane-2,3-dione isomerase